MEIAGYKAFNKDKTNRYGLSFDIGSIYRAEGNIVFGNNGNGYHLCTHICDIFRYVDALDDDILVAKVIGSGAYNRFDDEYFGYYDMYAFEQIEVIDYLNRDEILDLILKSSEYDVRKALKTYRFTDEEIKKIINKFRGYYGLIADLLYYQCGYTDIFERSVDMEYVTKKVLKNG